MTDNKSTGNLRAVEVSKKLRQTSFYRMPASTKYHNNFEGGLFDHCTGVWANLEKLTSSLGLQWQDPSSPFIIAMLHDACKIDAYLYNPDYKCWERNENHPAGHGDLSLAVISQLGIELTEEEMACIRWHMGAFDDKEHWNDFTEAIHLYPNVFWTHVADMMSAHIDEVKVAPAPKVEGTPAFSCVICGELQYGYGNNPQPVVDHGLCCDKCNYEKVIPARMGVKFSEE